MKEIPADGGWEEAGYSSPLIPLRQVYLAGPSLAATGPPPGLCLLSLLVPPGPVQLAVGDCTIPS